jgi:hypothetical protein
LFLRHLDELIKRRSDKNGSREVESQGEYRRPEPGWFKTMEKGRGEEDLTN